MQQRRNLLALLNGQKLDTNLIFSGLINVTVPGLESEGLQFHETHRDSVKMARAATIP